MMKFHVAFKKVPMVKKRGNEILAQPIYLKTELRAPTFLERPLMPRPVNCWSRR